MIILDQIAIPIRDLAIEHMDADDIDAHLNEVIEILVGGTSPIDAQPLDAEVLGEALRIVGGTPERHLLPVRVAEHTVADFHGPQWQPRADRARRGTLRLQLRLDFTERLNRR